VLQGWVGTVQVRVPDVGAVVHVAAGWCVARGTLADLAPVPYAAVLWAVGRGLPDEVVARMSGSRAETIWSWDTGPQAELLVAAPSPARQWFVVTGTLGEIEVRASPWSRGAAEVLVSDGTSTERLAVAAADLPRFADEDDVAAVLAAARRSAEAGGAPQRPA
jgi:hypothetical protein